MTLPYPIPRQTRQSEIFLGDGGMVYADFDFMIFDVADVEVWTLAVGDTHFSRKDVTVAKLAGLPFDDFTVTFDEAQLNTTQIVVLSRRLDERAAGVMSGSQINPTALEKEFSKISTEMQELRRDVDRAVTSDFGNTGFKLDAGLEIGDTLMIGPDGRIRKGPNAEDIVGVQGYAAEAKSYRDEAEQLRDETQSIKTAAEDILDEVTVLLPPIYAATRVALKAIDTTLFTMAYLKEAGREGQFIWKTGDFSARIAADTTEAIYIKADAIAATAGAWQRVYDGLNISTKWCGGNWQAAIDLAFVLGVPTVTPVGTYTATSGTGALKMRPGITLHNFAGTATLTQANGAQLANLLDFATYAAHGAKVINITIDGNRANNTDDIAAKHLILIYDTNDVTLQGCTITGSNGNGILIRDGVNAKILKNSISNVYVLPVAIGRSVKGNAFHEISENTISGEWGQHGIVVKYANYCVVRRNKITGQRLGTFTVNITGGNTIISQSGNYFTPASVGKFAILGGGIERLISGYVSPTTVVVSVGGLSGTGLTAVWGNGDVISIQGSDDCDVSENGVFGSASLGISIFSDGTNSANRNRIYKNRVASHGSAGISLQNIAGTFVLSTAIEGNVVIDCGLNLAAGDNSYNVGISCRGGANTQRVAVIGNQIEGYITPATMDYGIAFDAAVVNKFNSGNWVNGTVGGKTVQNP